ncbi:MAG: hypothetical protein EU539_12345 [Promethearchaeota archaeon]|nr:MAG: hypothetical protein EU539_12345 [Candidatus Lokiarchaeota archaeon]
MNGITAMGVFLFSILFGLFFLYRSRKLRADLLLFLGTTYIFAGLVYLGDTLDFITILLTGTNMDNSTGIIGLINWMWFPGAILSAIYISAELLFPEKKRHVVAFYAVLSIIFEIFLFLDPFGSVTYTNPVPAGSDLINDNLVEDSVVFFIALIFLLSVLLLLGVGFLIRAIKSSGDIRRNFLFLSIGAFIYTIGGILDGLLSPGIILIFSRSGMILSAWLFYLGIRP